MAESKSATKGSNKSGGSRSSNSKRARSGGSSSKKSTVRATSKRAPTATKRSAGTSSGRSRSSSRNGGDPSESDDGGGMSKTEEAQTGGKEMGRPPADEPDVFVTVPKLHVGELTIDVERLEAHLALRAQVANLVNLVAGAHVGVDKVKIEIKDVDAQCELKVRLENTYNILDRTLTTLDENPEIVKGLLETADSAVQETGEIGKEATKPGGAVSELTSGVGDTLGNLGEGLGDTLSSVAEKANPKRLVSGGDGGGSSSKQPSPGAGKTAARAGAVGAAGLVGAALVGSRKNGGPFRRRTAMESMAKSIYKVGKQVGKARKEIKRTRKAAEKVLP